MIKYGQHPRTGNLVQVIKRISASPPLFHVKVIAGDRIYYTNYLGNKLETKFEQLSRRKFNELARKRMQMTLFELEPIVAPEQDNSEPDRERCYFCGGYSFSYSLIKIDGIEDWRPTCKDHEV